jgi:hypothetical protein
MSQRSRLSMTDLATLRRPLVQSEIPVDMQTPVQSVVQAEAPPAVPATVPIAGAALAPESRSDHEEAPLVVSDKVSQTVPAPAPLAVPPNVPSDIILIRKKKVIRTAQSFRLPLELDQRWDDVAKHNGVSKTDLLLMGLERLLDQLPHPPNYFREDQKWLRK